MTQKARISDIGIGNCPCHDGVVSYTTIFSSGAFTIEANNLGSATIGSVGISSCGHPEVLASL